MKLLLVTYATLTFTSVVFLSLIRAATVDVYLALFAIEFFVTIELSPRFSPRVSRRIGFIAFGFVAMFAVIIIARLIEILI